MKAKKPKGGGDSTQSWWPKLAENVTKLFDEIDSERAPVVQPPTDAPPIQQGLLQLEDAVPRRGRLRLRSLSSRTRADRVWAAPRADESAGFANVNGGLSLKAVMSKAFCDDGLVGMSSEARTAFLRLLSWDLRYLWRLDVMLMFRNAQLADDREFLKRVGNALWQNARYGGRGQRKQKLLTRLLLQFQFGDRDAYDDKEYRERIYDGLLKAFQEAGVPESHPAMEALLELEYFNTHVRRLRDSAHRNDPT